MKTLLTILTLLVLALNVGCSAAKNACCSIGIESCCEVEPTPVAK